MNAKELAKRCRNLATDYASGSLWCGREEETAQRLSEAAEALERCAELETDAERLDAIQRNEWDLISMIDDDESVFWVIQETSPDGSQIASGNTAREAINAAIDALRSRESCGGE